MAEETNDAAATAKEKPATRSKEDLKTAIKKGGSVLHEGRLIRTEQQLDHAFETEEDIDRQIEEASKRKAAKASSKKGAAKK